MNTTHTIVGLGLTMGAAVTAAVAPAHADTHTPEPISAQVTKATSASRQTSSEVTVEGTWATPHLTPGSVLTVGSINGGFNWLANFPFTLSDGTRIGECVADQATLTCTVTDIPEAWAAKQDVTGTFYARARIVDAAVGTQSTSITLNGQTVRTLVWGDRDGTGECSSDCQGPAHYEYARPETIKFGWTNRDGSIGWGIQWRIDPGIEYTITDETNTLHTAVKCSTGPTWDPKTTSWTDGKLDETRHALTFTPPTGALTCVTYPDATKPIDGVTTYTNKATINGMSLEATTTVKSAGGTDGDGSAKPTPTPEPTTPAPKPSDEPQSTPTTPKPTTQTPTPAPRVTTEPVYVPTHATQKPAPQAQLAKTGATLDGIKAALAALALGVFLAACVYASNLRGMGGEGR